MAPKGAFLSLFLFLILSACGGGGGGGDGGGGSTATAKITLAWDASSSPDVVGYRIYYGTSPGVYPNMVDVGPVLTGQVSGLTPGTVYYFVTTAYTSQLESDFSNEASGPAR